METFNFSGRVPPVGSTDQGLVNQKITDKDEQRQGTWQHPKKKLASVQTPENEDEGDQPKDHVIDIIV